MKTLIVDKKKKLSVIEVPIPVYTEKQALVRTLSCGICNGTDGKLIHQKFKGITKEQYPLMLGHEAVGEVIAVGSQVKRFHIGDKVLLPFTSENRELYGELESAWGAFSEYGIVDDFSAYEPGKAPDAAYAQTVLPKDIDPIDAAVIITLREVLSAIYRFGIQKGSSAAVFGCGPVGLTFIKFFKMLGISPVIAFDRHEEKLKEALEKGADYTFHTGKYNAKEELRKIWPQGVEFVIDAAGIPELINQAMEYICDGGKICCYGIAPKCSMEIDWGNAPYNWLLQFQQFPDKKEEGKATEQILKWIKAGEINLKDYISDYFRFDSILEAFEKLENKEIRKKGIVVYP